MASPSHQSGPEPPLGVTQLAALERVLVRGCGECGRGGRGGRGAGSGGSKYEVLSAEGAVVLVARDHTPALAHLLAGTNRALSLHLHDTQGRLVMTVRRPYSLSEDKMSVGVWSGAEGAVGAVGAAGAVRRQETLVKPVLVVLDAAERPLFRVKGPAQPARHAPADYQVLNMNKKQVGVIRRRGGEGGGYCVQLPGGLDVRGKATLLATCFLIDFLYYEL